MGKATYQISSSDTCWTVSHSGAAYPYRTRAIAISAAIDAARSSGLRGHEAEVFVEDGDGGWLEEWVFGRDPYPDRR